MINNNHLNNFIEIGGIVCLVGTKNNKTAIFPCELCRKIIKHLAIPTSLVKEYDMRILEVPISANDIKKESFNFSMSESLVKRVTNAMGKIEI